MVAGDNVVCPILKPELAVNLYSTRSTDCLVAICSAVMAFLMAPK